MNDTARCILAVLLVSGLASGFANAQTKPPPPSQGTSPWNASTTPPPPSPPGEDSLLSLRIYNDLNRNPLPSNPPGPSHKPDPSKHPGTGRLDEPAYAVDVSAVMTHCSDGSLVITGLVIGGQLTPLSNRCPDGPGKAPAKPAPACEANRWNCATAPAE